MWALAAAGTLTVLVAGGVGAVVAVVGLDVVVLDVVGAVLDVFDASGLSPPLQPTRASPHTSAATIEAARVVLKALPIPRVTASPLLATESRVY